MSLQCLQVPDVHNPFVEVLSKAMDALVDDAFLARLQALIDALTQTMLSPSARSSLDRIRERLPYLITLARSQQAISSSLEEKTAHSILDEMNLCISRYQKVSSLLKEKEQLITKIAALQSPLDSFQIKLGEEFLRV